MNVRMWIHKATQKNLDALIEYGYKFIGPENGRLASGLIGKGRLSESKKILGIIRKTLGKETEFILRSLQYPTDVKCLIDGEWIMQRTGLKPGIKLGRLKDWLFRIQIERGYRELSQMETALCTIPWQSGKPEEWPRPKWA